MGRLVAGPSFLFRLERSEDFFILVIFIPFSSIVYASPTNNGRATLRFREIGPMEVILPVTTLRTLHTSAARYVWHDDGDVVWDSESEGLTVSIAQPPDSEWEHESAAGQMEVLPDGMLVPGREHERGRERSRSPRRRPNA